MNELLKCDNCKEKLKDPSCLPCGKTICKDCVQIKFEDLNNSSKCEFCSDSHSKNEFRKNDLINSLIDVDNLESLQESENSLKPFLRRVKYLSQELLVKINEPKKLIKKHVSDVKNEIEMTRKNLIKSINDEFDEFIIQVENYENNCLDNLKKDSTQVSKQVDEIKGEIYKFYSKWDNYLNKSSLCSVILSETDLIRVRQEVKNLIIDLLRKEKNYMNLLFDHKFLRFSSKNQLNNKSLCYVYFDEKPIDNECNESNEEITQKFKLNEFGKMKTFNHLKNHSWNSIIQDKNNTQVVLILMTFKVIFFKYTKFTLTKINLNSDQEVKNTFYPNITLLMNISHHPWLEINDSNIFLLTDSNQSNIMMFDKNLNIIKVSQKLEHHISSSTVNQTRIICFDKTATKLYIYNMNFYLLKTVGQDLHLHDPFYLKNLVSIKSTDNFLIVQDMHNKIIIMDLNEGSYYNEFSINSANFLLYMGYCILTYNQSSITLYTFEGEKFEFKINSNDLIPNLNMFGYNQNGLSFVNWNTNEVFLCDNPKNLNKF